MLLLGAVLLAIVARRAGRAALAGLGRTLAASVTAALLAAAAGIGARQVVESGATPGIAGALGQGMLSGSVVAVAFVGVVYALDRRDVRPLLAATVRRASRLARRRGAAGAPADDHGAGRP
jgi:putative peptidoglycan lipid II flippase